MMFHWGIGSSIGIRNLQKNGCDVFDRTHRGKQLLLWGFKIDIHKGDDFKDMAIKVAGQSLKIRILSKTPHSFLEMYPLPLNSTDTYIFANLFVNYDEEIFLELMP